MQLRELSTWLPLVNSLRKHAPTEAATTTWRATIFANSYGSRLQHFNTTGEQLRTGDTYLPNELGKLRDETGKTISDRGCCVEIRIHQNRSASVTVVEFSDSSYADSGESGVGDLLLIDGARPEPYRKLAVLDVTHRLAKSADPAAVAQLVREKLPNAVGASLTDIAAAENTYGIQFTDELRALYEAANEGELIVGDEDSEFYGLEIVPLQDFKTRQYYLPEYRYATWEFGALEVLSEDPDGRVQTLAGSSSWFIFGHDWGGNAYAIDLAPGPNGNLGQVIYLDHELNSGAIVIAESLADLLIHQRVSDGRLVENPAKQAHVNARSGKTIASITTPELEVLSIDMPNQPVDLAPLLGHPQLRTVKSSSGSLQDPRQLTELSALEYLAIGESDWRILLDTDQVPAGLLAARVTSTGNDDLATIVSTANELLARWNRPVITATKLEA